MLGLNHPVWYLPVRQEVLSPSFLSTVSQQYFASDILPRCLFTPYTEGGCDDALVVCTVSDTVSDVEHAIGMAKKIWVRQIPQRRGKAHKRLPVHVYNMALLASCTLPGSHSWEIY